MKKLYYTQWFETNFFFDEGFNLIHRWSCDDVLYRHEYMSPLFKKLGYEMTFIDYKDERVKQSIIKALKCLGFTDADFE